MGSFGEDPNKGIDATVGGLVWVRRRNGSWWPGRIVGQDELPEGCVPTPRAGTPVKLLGREDASVDWYNLERSKRVKPFRCGEYDDCIEKAKSSASASAPHLSKKSVKYARREEAILEALELESARLGKDCPNDSAGPDTLDGEQHLTDESPSLKSDKECEDIDKYLNNSEGESDSPPEVSQSGVSFEETNLVDGIMEESKRLTTPNDSEDDGIEGAKRTRGLEDLGMGVASSPRRKRSQGAHVHNFLKRKNRRQTLTKVLECTTTVPVPDVPEKLSSPTESSVPGASESKVSELESNESKLNNSLVINNSDSTGVSCENPDTNTPRHSSDRSLRTEPKENEISSIQGTPVSGSSKQLYNMSLPHEEKYSAGLPTIVSGAPQKTLIGAGAQSSQSSRVETASLGSEEHNESGSTSSGTADIHNIEPRMDKGTSKWQSKGKRNSRLRKTDIDDEVADRFDGGSRHQKLRPVTDIQVEETRGWTWNSPQRQSRTGGSTPDTAAPQRLLPYRQSRYNVNPKYDDFDFSLRNHTAGSGLYDVPVEVRANHRTQHVPFVSLMSRLSGQPIVGHPLTVEALDDGSCNDLLTFSECHSSTSELDHNLTNISANRNADPVYKRKTRGRPPRKHRAILPTKSPKSRRNTPSSKKVRRLSSLTSLHKQDESKPLVEKITGPCVACVPLKVVFSRINAALNG